jgi:predicted acyltransferase
VLQRIAICYLIAGAIFLTTKIRGQIAWNIFFLVLYAVLMQGNYDKETNFARYVDGLFLKGHMWSHTKVWDPEGVISTLPAISSALFGVLTGHLVRSKLDAAAKTAWLLIGGNALVFLGMILNPFIPINKSLWTDLLFDLHGRTGVDRLRNLLLDHRCERVGNVGRNRLRFTG